MPAFCFSLLFDRLSQQEHKVFPVGQESFLQWQPIYCLDGKKLQEELQQMLRSNSECLAVLIFKRNIVPVMSFVNNNVWGIDFNSVHEKYCD